MSSSQQHDDVIRQAFTAQAANYAANPVVADPKNYMTLVEATRPGANDRVLDIATGPGYVAAAFARASREVIGVDLTAAPLKIAEKNRDEHGLSNLTFRVADASQLPFEDNEFDIVASRFAFHHFADPMKILSEMARVCRPGGRVGVEDLIASEHPDRATFHNRFEQLRDPSHTAALSLSQLLALFTRAGLEIESVSSVYLLQDFEAWLSNAHTPEREADETRQMIAQDREQDLSGLRPFEGEDGRLKFYHHKVTLAGYKLG
jgi:ubiquinone/menaquinone biosynthesis C-methylase UbiE